MFNSSSFSNAFGYECWLVFDVLTVFGFSYLLNNQLEFNQFVRFYLNSFFAMALVGLVQFVLYPLGINFFVEQTWTSSIARINGFSYEPSYYATYMLMGFVMHAYLLEKRSVGILEHKALTRNFIVISIAMVLSSSRMGWLMMAVWVGVRLLFVAKQALGKGRRALARLRIPHALYIFIAVAAVVAVFVFCVIKPDLSVFGAGLGIFGATTTHSSSDRIAGLQRCIAIFLEHPLWGYSLGGVDPAIAEYRGLVYTSSMNGAAMSIIGELLVANGVVGLIPFLLYFGICISSGIQSDVGQDNPQAVLHRALVWALVFELGILCMNQNILRPYLWLHIAVLAASWNICKNTKHRADAQRIAQVKVNRSAVFGGAR